MLCDAIVQNGLVLCRMPESNWKRERPKTERQLCCHFSMFDGFLVVLFSANTHICVYVCDVVMTKPMIMGNGSSDCTAGGDVFILVSFSVSVRMCVCVCVRVLTSTELMFCFSLRSISYKIYRYRC